MMIHALNINVSVWGVIVVIFMGALIGFIASKLMKSKGGLFRNIVVGIVGSLIGSFLGSLIDAGTGFWMSLIMGTIGSMILIGLSRFLVGK